MTIDRPTELFRKAVRDGAKAEADPNSAKHRRATFMVYNSVPVTRMGRCDDEKEGGCSRSRNF